MIQSSNTISHDWFYPILIGSVAVHFILISYFKAINPHSDFSVEKAPNSISISISKSKPMQKPIIKEVAVEPPIVEKIEEFVKEPVVEEVNVEAIENEPINEIIVPEPVIEKAVESVPEIIEDVVEEKNEPIVQEQVIKETIISEESLGAVTEAKPMEYINPAPRYPSIAKRRGWEGTVWLRVSVNSKGLVEQVDVNESSGYSTLDKSALKTVRDWQFEPAKKGYRSISSVVMVPVEFKLVDNKVR